MRKSKIFINWIKAWSWAFWFAALLSVAPPAILYVGIVGGDDRNKSSSSLTKDELEKMSECVLFLRGPGLLLMPGRYPSFWHSHIRPERFWTEVTWYFGLNFFAWWVVLIVVGYTGKLGKKFLSTTLRD